MSTTIPLLPVLVQVFWTMATPAAANDWKAGFCGCCGDCKNCLIGYFVPCVLFGMNAQKIPGGSFLGDNCAVNAIVWCISRGLCGVLDWKVRIAVAEKYGIVHNPGMEFLKVFCCPCCAMIQEATELDSHAGEAPAGATAYTAAPAQ
mmetsp:Transcript_15707/g.39917  ORF Transcript_15707/g.39917 Transcript_15707/m.39917 type:complete len:147 (-) Transcript_15707:164-604(-)